jgi:hypothetical protein
MIFLPFTWNRHSSTTPNRYQNQMLRTCFFSNSVALESSFNSSRATLVEMWSIWFCISIVVVKSAQPLLFFVLAICTQSTKRQSNCFYYSGSGRVSAICLLYCRKAQEVFAASKAHSCGLYRLAIVVSNRSCALNLKFAQPLLFLFVSD